MGALDKLLAKVNNAIAGNKPATTTEPTIQRGEIIDVNNQETQTVVEGQNVTFNPIQSRQKLGGEEIKPGTLHE